MTSAFGRMATSDVAVDGVTVPAGDTVFAVPAAANRDERAYADPDLLDITREGPPNVTFGLGPHLCIGAPLARVELQEALAGVLRRFPDVRLAVPESELVWKRGNLIRGVRSLPVAW
jgi:nocardicin N-oxygenase